MTDVLVVGGGLAGGAAGTLLARAGRTVHVLERHSSPADKICGEFLSIEAQKHLEDLGINLAALGAVPINHIRVISNGQTVERSLPFVARGLSRRLLDEALLHLAEKAGVVVERGVRVTEIETHAASTSQGPRRADVILLATGKLPVRAEGIEAPPVLDAHVGFKMHWRANASIRRLLEDCIELNLMQGGYAGLQLVEGDTANLCLVIRRSRLAALGGRWEDVLMSLGGLSPALSALIDAQPLFSKPLTAANLAYGRLPRGRGESPVFRLGDQAAMTPSLTGDGMAIALRSAWLAAQFIMAGRSAADYHRALAKMVGPQVRRGMLLQRATEATMLRSAGISLLRMQPRLLRSIIRLTRLPDPAPPFRGERP
ncbi:FAD-dependent monooxygenase [Sphingobium sufflavum]|uniref:NAD(P)/FAD-dependent oxidoreductase n=1 Tax=Sphingobium sufflavum TaxID=1129547 RepID=UPI001F174E07|nr:FAD-dependent monooxygenase [Sphingobium sufflavum]MCE7796558.1 FAD-dependent monooxygenase [Sphingobium sufflavum]